MLDEWNEIYLKNEKVRNLYTITWSRTKLSKKWVDENNNDNNKKR